MQQKAWTLCMARRDTPDYTALARQFMDLWQDQMSEAIKDQAFISAMLDTMQEFQQQSGFTSQESKRGKGAQRSAATSRPDDERVAELERRLAACESRIALLEAEQMEATPKRRKHSG